MLHIHIARKRLVALGAIIIGALLLVVTGTAGGPASATETCDKVVGKPSLVYANPDYPTINAAINALKGMDKPLKLGFTLCVLDGIYEERVVILDDGGEFEKQRDEIDELAGLRLIAYPDGNRVRPIIDGRNLYFRSWYDGLVWINESGVLFQGFEVRRSNGRGISVGGYDSLNRTTRNITIRDVYVHDNWTDGIVTNGQTQAVVKPDGTVIEPGEIHRFYPWNIRVEDSRIFRNGRKARAMPVIFEGRRIEGVVDPNAWTFIGNGLNPWNAPYWQGKFLSDPGLAPTTDHSAMSYLPTEGLDAISVQLATPGGNNPPTDRVLISTPAGTGVIPAGHTIYTDSTGKDVALNFDGADILELDKDGKWKLFFDGKFVQDKNTSIGSALNIDGFELTGDGKLLVSFGWNHDKFPILSINVPGIEYPVYPGDLLVFTPESMGIDTKGTFSYYQGLQYDKLGFVKDCEARDPKDDCINSDLKDFAFGPSGTLVARIERDDSKGSPIDRPRDIMEFDATAKKWNPYMYAELKFPPVNWEVEPVKYQFNPMGSGGQAVSIGTSSDGQVRLFVSGRVEGAVGLGFTATGTSWAINNQVHENYGEGLSVYFNAQEVNIIGNSAYENLHSNIYINDVQDAIVDSNFAYCTDDLRFWGAKGDGSGYNPNNGITNRDEDYGQEKSLDARSKTRQSSYLIITNNIVVGCNRNLLIARQENGPGLIQSTIPGCTVQEPVPLRGLYVVHNTFVEARSDNTVSSVGSVEIYDHNPKTPCVSKTPYESSLFANNVIAQGSCKGSTASTDIGKCEITNKKQPVGLEMRNNLYQAAYGWTQAYQQIGDPLLVFPVAPKIGDEVLPDSYQLRTTNSPAYANGAVLDFPILPKDFFGNARYLYAPDIGAHEFVMSRTCNRDEKDGTSLAVGDVICGSVSSENGNWTDTFQFKNPVQGYVMAAVNLTDFNATELEISIKRADGRVMVSDVVQKKGEYLLFTGMYGGDYTITVTDKKQVANSYTFYELTLTKPLLVSAAARNLGIGNVAGIPFQSGDILAWASLNNNQEKWWMFFDASDVGIVRNVSNVAAGDPNHAGRILLSIAGLQSVPDLGPVRANDIIAFDAKRYGSETSGTFKWGLKGSDVELTTSSEIIDGLDGWVFGYEAKPTDFGCFGFPISTAGLARVTGWVGTMTQDNEDVFCKVYDEAHGGWKPWDWFFDINGRSNQPASSGMPGNMPGLAQKNVIALSYDDFDDIMYLAIRGGGVIDGHTVSQKDIFAINYPAYTWGGVVWSGPEHGWNYPIDAFEWDGK